MKNATVAAKKLRALLKKITKTSPPVEAEVEAEASSMDVLVSSFLLWQATTDRAITAGARLHATFVDHNDLRASMPSEVVEVIGERYPLAVDRAQRLRAVLRDIYNREHSVSLDRLNGLGKREVKKYVESLDGIPTYVSARLMLLSFDIHGVPVDDHLLSLLQQEGVADEDTDAAELSAWLGRQVKAGTAIQVHRDLQAWADSSSSKPRPRSKKKTAAKTTKRAATTSVKKTTKKKTTGTKASASRGGRTTTKSNRSTAAGRS